jgi:hypothetical protein
LAACKTRKVSLSQTTTTTLSQTTEQLKKDSTGTDSIATASNIKTISSRRDSFEIYITPDTGSVKISHGNYSGKAKQIVIKGIYTAQSLNNTLSLQNQVKRSHIAQSDSIINKTQSQQSIKQKTVSSKPGIGTYILPIILLLLVGAAYACYKLKWLPGI